MRLYFENPVGRIYSYSEGFLRLEYKPGLRELEELKALVRHLRNLFEHSGYHKILVDQRQMREFTPRECTWIAEYWRHLAENRPPLYRATLMPLSSLARLASANLLAMASTIALINKSFEDEAKALGWLLETSCAQVS
ncbi:hypothetical protein [Solirubrum puertoriconensis]|uniref:STAS/SEC14 domain-containing protein n=1 Tax=Solirubrum puertoriconensis TaxID=1751427 RepID=A0A9X0HMI9_SOLP1|nr:hypothetical protein [Solirubrum puertoriconensis]KUG08706.1 hypothetical protein ASU33_11230 [Solirubrum puertoriconensis]